MKYDYKVDRKHRLILCKMTDKFDRTWIGRARCLPDEEFDEERGKHLARVRAILEMKKRDIIGVIDGYESVEQTLKDYMESLAERKRVLKRWKDRISELKNEERQLCGRE